MSIIEFWEELGVDKDSVLARFVGNVGLATKCTKKYLSDKTFDELESAVNAKDYHMVEMAAHTIKGLAGNLGFDKIQIIGQKIVDNVRADAFDSLESDFEQLKVEHEKICCMLEEL